MTKHCHSLDTLHLSLHLVQLMFVNCQRLYRASFSWISAGERAELTKSSGGFKTHQSHLIPGTKWLLTSHVKYKISTPLLKVLL